MELQSSITEMHEGLKDDRYHLLPPLITLVRQALHLGVRECMCGDSGVDVPLSRVARWEASSGSIAYADLAGSYMASGKRRSSP
jgi:hypothetical protein